MEQFRDHHLDTGNKLFSFRVGNEKVYLEYHAVRYVGIHILLQSRLFHADDGCAAGCVLRFG